MVIDTSALLAILLGEPEATDLTDAIASAGRRMVGAPTLVEASAVLVARKGPQGEIALERNPAPELIRAGFLASDAVRRLPDYLTIASTDPAVTGWYSGRARW
ncbi:MAG TPA: type II toxin-antitoxin system VapC family toxin [Longimicrobiaceae bacterium]|nr:type II toxin-antitoxin system VapC family toxin [Longimicrobiaceae bacterium]